MNVTKLTPSLDNYGGALVIINGRKCNMNSVRRYVEYNNAVYGENNDPDAEVARESARNNPLFWISLQSLVICGDAGHYKRESAKWANVPSIKTGECVEFDGSVFRVEPTFNNNFKLIFA